MGKPKISSREVQVKARLGKYSGWNTEPRWQPWADTTLNLIYANGYPVSVRVKGQDWAEYCPNHLKKSTFESNGYYLELEPAGIEVLNSEAEV